MEKREYDFSAVSMENKENDSAVSMENKEYDWSDSGGKEFE